MSEATTSPRFDRITRLAHRIFDVSSAAISLVGEGRQWYLSQAGREVPAVPAEDSFCLRALQSERTTIVQDARTDPRFAQHAAVQGAPGIRFYAAAPLVMRDGFRPGVLCLFDTAPQTLDAEEQATLEDLAGILVDGLEQWRQLHVREQAERRETKEPLHTHEELIASISENVSEGIFRSEPGKGLTYVNRACAEMFGYDSPEALLHVDPPDLYANPERRDEVIRRMRREGGMSGMEVLYKQKDGDTFWGLTSGRTTYDDEGRVQYRDGAVIDITQRKQMEARLRESEERWHRLVENHPEAVFINVDGEFRYANAAASRLLGASRAEELIGRSVFDFLPSDVVSTISERLRLVKAGSPTPLLEHEIIRLDGEKRIIEVNSVPVSYEGEDAIQTVARDITERRAAEEQLRTAEAKFRGLVEQSLVGIYIIQNGKLAYVNPALAEIVGYPVDELIGADAVTLFIHEDDRPTVRRKIRQRAQGEIEEARYTFRVRRKDGAVVHVEAHGTRTEHDGQPAIIGTLLDVTERREWEQQLIRAKEEAEEMNRLKSAFLANMSHEIRTPLTSIIGFADLIGTNPESAGKFAELIQRSGQRLLWTLNSVLDLAQLEAGALELKPTEMDIREEVRDVLDQFRLQAQQKELNLQLDVPDRPVMIALDQVAFLRVLSNLVSNAIKFTPEGEVTVSVRSRDEDVVLRVIDTGIGIGRDFLDEIFDEFRQESVGAARTHEGSGLGLTITHRLVELMGGTIDVESTLGEGSTFTVCLPRYTEEA